MCSKPGCTPPLAGGDIGPKPSCTPPAPLGRRDKALPDMGTPIGTHPPDPSSSCVPVATDLYPQASGSPIGTMKCSREPAPAHQSAKPGQGCFQFETNYQVLNYNIYKLLEIIFGAIVKIKLINLSKIFL